MGSVRLSLKANSHSPDRHRQTATDTFVGFCWISVLPRLHLLALVGAYFCWLNILNWIFSGLGMSEKCCNVIWWPSALGLHLLVRCKLAFMLTRAISQNSNMVKWTVICFNILWIVIYSCDGKDEFSVDITPLFNVTWSLGNHFNMLICCSMNTYYYYQCCRQLCCLIFLLKPCYIFSKSTE